MTQHRPFIRRLLGAGALLATFTLPAWAQGYPNKPITIVVPFAAGSGSDLTARALAKDMAVKLGQPAVVINRPGANGSIGVNSVVSAAPDGYTLLLGSGTTQAANFAFKLSNLGYKPDSMVMVSGIGASPVMLFVAQNNPQAGVRELVQDAKKNVGRLSCSSGNAVTEVACAVFKRQAGIFAATIPYRSNSQSLQDLAGGVISFSFSDAAAALTLIEGKRVRPIAVAASARLSTFKDVPTFAEAGFKDMEITAWTGLFAPAGTPRDVLDKLNTVVKAHTESEEAVRFRARTGGLSIWSSVDDAQKFLTAEQSKWQRFIQTTGVTPFL